jgi:hypothetical protein
LLLGVVARGALVCAILGRPIPATDGLAAGFAYKERIAEGIHEPKILFVGGSSVDLGISAKAASEQLGIPCVNYGFMVPMGLEYILHLTRKAARPGDTVVLALEYTLFDWGGGSKCWLDPTYIEYICSRDPGYLDALPAAHQPQVHFRVTNTHLLDALFRSSNRTVDEMLPSIAEYRNANGDRTDNTRSMRPKLANHRERPLENLLEGMNSHPKGFGMIKDFIAWAGRNRVRVIATFPNMARNEAYDRSRLGETESTIREFYHGLGVPVIGSVEGTMFPVEDCYDSLFHLVDEAVLDRTTALVKLLEPIVGAEPQTNRSTPGF